MTGPDSRSASLLASIRRWSTMRCCAARSTVGVGPGTDPGNAGKIARRHRLFTRRRRPEKAVPSCCFRTDRLVSEPISVGTSPGQDCRTEPFAHSPDDEFARAARIKQGRAALRDEARKGRNAGQCVETSISLDLGLSGSAGPARAHRDNSRLSAACVFASPLAPLPIRVSLVLQDRPIVALGRSASF